jgi:hypothetical protein
VPESLIKMMEMIVQSDDNDDTDHFYRIIMMSMMMMMIFKKNHSAIIYMNVSYLGLKRLKCESHEATEATHVWF